MTQLSPHFSLAELTHSDTATLHGIPNVPDDAELLNLSRLATTVLEPARQACGDRPMLVHDAFRCEAVNELVGGVPDSQHRLGLAADIAIEGLALEEVFDTIRRAADVPYDQCILESGCIHLSASPDARAPRRQALVRHGLPGAWEYTEAGA